MFPIALSDLDELILHVRTPLARAYIGEAVAAYRAGALRAAIVAAWVAVAYDIVSKIRELAALGDPNARRQADALDAWIRSAQRQKLQQFEGELLRIAEESFEFLAPHERRELERLQDDRNLCDHPAFVSDEALFTPTPDQVRAHIVAAIQHLLRHQPVQGRSALQRVLRDLVSETFPSTQDEVDAFMRAKYLDRAKEALLRNLAITLVKILLTGDDPDVDLSLYRDDLLRGLTSIRNRHPTVYENLMRDRVREIAETLDDNQLDNLFPLLRADERAWDWLGDPTRARLRTRVLTAEPDPTSPIFDAVGIAGLAPDFEQLIEQVDDDTLAELIVYHPAQQFIPRALRLFEESSSFRVAERRGEALLSLAGLLDADDVRAILQAAQANNQIWDASGTPRVLHRLFASTRERLQARTIRYWREFLASMEEEGQEEYYASLARAIRGGK